jgi:uncharacterized protein YndB with AHSA1/START domain
MSDPIAKAEMLIRKPVAQVFEAFIDPAITSRFWFTKGSGRLEAGKHLSWDWEMYGMSTQVEVREIERDRCILVEWSAYGGTLVEWMFTPRGADETFVSITHRGFKGTAEEMTDAAINATEGFTFVVSGLKAWLEHGIALNLVYDRFPDKRVAAPQPSPTKH